MQNKEITVTQLLALAALGFDGDEPKNAEDARRVIIGLRKAFNDA